jgi:hypothetical protein
MNLPGRHTQILDVHRIRRFNYRPVACDVNSTADSISDSEDWLTWSGNLDHPNVIEDDCAADFEFNIVLYIGIEDAECPEQQDASATATIHRLIGTTWKSKSQAEMLLVTVSETEMNRNQAVKEK